MAPGLVPYPLVGGGISDETKRQLYQNFNALERLAGNLPFVLRGEGIGVGVRALAALSPVNNQGGTAFGYEALMSITTGTGNTAVGAEALRGATTGSANVAVGESALNVLTTGENNVALGAYALAGVTTQSDNVGVGASSVAGGARNVGVGHQALQSISVNDTVALGYRALDSNTTGTGNTAVGFEAGGTNGIADPITTGSNNTFIGYQTRLAASAQRSGATCVGAASSVDGDNATTLGFSTSAGAAGAIAIGRDSAGTSAATATADEAALGTALTSLKVGDPGGGQGAWMLGQYKTAAVTLDTANYIEVKIDGTLRKLAIVT